MDKYTLRNDYHDTTHTVLMVAGQHKLSPSQVRRAHDALCGANDCTCSGALGVRGPQTCEVGETQPGKYYLYPLEG